MEALKEALTPGFIEMLLTILTTTLASSGFWMFILKRNESKDNRNKLLMGLAHDRILSLGMQYISRGYVTRDEYENLCEYLYTPYSQMGGNGIAKKIMAEIDNLPIKKSRLEERTFNEAQ